MSDPFTNRALTGTLIDFIPDELIRICQHFHNMITLKYKYTSFISLKDHDIYLNDTLLDFVCDDIKKLIDNEITNIRHEIIHEKMRKYLKSIDERMGYTDKKLIVNSDYDRQIWYRRVGLIWQPIPITTNIDIPKLIKSDIPEKTFTFINKPPPSRRQKKLTFPKKQNYYHQQFKNQKQNKRNFGSGR